MSSPFVLITNTQRFDNLNFSFSLFFICLFIIFCEREREKCYSFRRWWASFRRRRRRYRHRICYLYSGPSPRTKRFFSPWKKLSSKKRYLFISSLLFLDRTRMMGNQFSVFTIGQSRWTLVIIVIDEVWILNSRSVTSV